MNAHIDEQMDGIGDTRWSLIVRNLGQWRNNPEKDGFQKFLKTLFDPSWRVPG